MLVGSRPATPTQTRMTNIYPYRKRPPPDLKEMLRWKRAVEDGIALSEFRGRFGRDLDKARKMAAEAGVIIPSLHDTKKMITKAQVRLPEVTTTGKRALARVLKCSLAEVEAHLAAGERRCRGRTQVGEVPRTHWGKFDPGKALCITCESLRGKK